MRRAHWNDEVLTSTKIANLWEFSAKNTFATPSKASNFADLICSLSVLHKFGQYFDNNETVEFISAAKDFIVNYSDHARPNPALARLFAYWINCKLSLFRSTILVDRLVKRQSDDKLAALRDSSQSWKPLSTPVRLRISDSDKCSHGQRAPMTSRIPSEVFSQLPEGEDGRRVCLKFLSKSGCQYANCSSSHFRAEEVYAHRQLIIGTTTTLTSQFPRGSIASRGK
ncbi:hypothetical protein PHMEG_0009258 [Phytophthora megakarya]|uniref:Uncharacterized protein n=1 Tax=Phytophthora megakarya TaxID=4795 RepID=A0A225WI16_9STRA|nr:hypothetical protein PHMEG_0009258 [Phytophthora megakarya]